MSTVAGTASPDQPGPAPSPATRSVLIADTLHAAALAELEKLDLQVTSDPGLTAETLPDAVGQLDPDMLIVRSTKVLGPALKQAGKLSLIVRAGAGYDNIDVEGASRRGIFVANCPGRNAIAVAELAWGLILCCDRRLPDQTIDLRAGVWNKKQYGQARGLHGRTLGIVGLGLIGREVASRAQAFGMKVVAWSRRLTQERADELGVGFCSSIYNLARMVDVVSVNVAATPETRHLIDDRFFQAMKDGAYFVNTSRGSVVDAESLARAVHEKGIRAGLDVYDRQPSTPTGDFADPVINEPLVYGTHHCGASTDQAQEAIAREAVRIVRLYQRTGRVAHCVNQAQATSATALLTVRHLNRPGVLAHVFYTLGQARINVQEMENIICEGAEAACARIQLDATPDAEHIRAISSNDHVLAVDVSTIRHPS